MTQRGKRGSSRSSSKKKGGAEPRKSERYIVLARRHRPSQFEQVIGQEHVTRTLQNAIRADRVHHAYLFTGSRGVGKTTVARLLARALNHPDGPTPDLLPIDQTEPEHTSTDVIEIDGASHTGVDDVRELRESARYLPAGSRHKIYIIDEVHMLSTSAFNALLKTLEEPPPHVIFVFATTEPHKIPATILSRCQRFDFKRVPAALIRDHLQRLLEQEPISVEEAGLSLIARAAEGGVRDALSLLDQVIAYHAASAETVTVQQVAEVLGVADRRVLFELSDALLARDTARALAVVDRLFSDGHDLAQFSQAFLAHLRDMVVAASCDDPAPLVDATEAELTEMAAQAERCEPALLQQHFDRFARAAEEIARSSFPRLLLEMALIEMAQAEPLLPLGDLLQRLEEMERRLGAPSGFGPGGSSPARPRSTKRAPAASPPRGAGAKSETSGARAEPTSGGNGKPERPSGRPGTALERWQSLLQKLDGPIAATYVSGRLIGWEGDTIELGFPGGAFELQTAQEKRRLGELERHCSRQAGRPLKVTVRPLTPEEESSPAIVEQSAAEAHARARQERARRLREEAEAHPITRSLVDSFGATITRVTTEANGKAHE